MRAWFLTTLILAGTAWAEPQLITVPVTQTDPAVPHVAHEGAAITLKAIIRSPGCAAFSVRWDVDRDGDFDDEEAFNASRYNNRVDSIRDAGRTFVVPAVDRSGLMTINVEARSQCTDAAVYGSYRLYVHDWQPDPDPRQWTAEQIEVMAAMALDEVLWFMHRQLRSLSGHTADAHLKGTTRRADVNALLLWLYAVNGHQPAFPPGTVQGTDAHPLPDGWTEANDARWRTDPYAETAVRVLNKLLQDTKMVAHAIDPADEDNTCGFAPDGTERRCVRVPHTADRTGIYIGNSNSHRHAYENGVNLGGLATILPALADVPIPSGKDMVRGRTYAWLVQQMADNLGAMQIDDGCARGGWYYHHTHGNHCGYADASTAQWAYIGLESAEVAGRPYGVVVPNRVKYRVADNFVRNQSAEGGARYRTSHNRGSTLQLTGGALVAGRWLGVHTFAADDETVAFPTYSAHTRGALRQAYDRYLSFTAANWRASQRRGNIGWADGLWHRGDPLCGDLDGAYNVDTRCGNSYAIYSYQKGFRTGLPELDRVGNTDWYRQFATYYIRAQHRTVEANSPRGNAYERFGEVGEDYSGPGHAIAYRLNNRTWIPIMAGLVLTPTIFSAKPEAVAEARPATVTAGCAGGQAGRVALVHEASFHPNDDAEIVTWQWDVDARNGLWWAQGLAPDHQVERAAGAAGSVTHVYETPGQYTATLRVIDGAGLSRTTTLPVEVRAPVNRAPTASAGGPYVVEVGAGLQLNGEISDPNTGCGDALTIEWTVGDTTVEGASPVIPWADLAELGPGAHPVRLTVTDREGERVQAESTVRIFAPEPVAAFDVGPIDAACGQPVRFDASRSHHPNPDRQIASLSWDVDGEPGVDGAGQRFEWRYRRFGDYAVTLRVVDDLGRAATAQAQVRVNQGNRPPVARADAPAYVVPRGEGLTVDARASHDPDADCGDAITAWRWDFDGDGQTDAEGAQLALDAATVAARAGTWTLTVEDDFGATDQLRVEVRVSDAAPVPVIVQFPAPAPVIDGVASAGLEARESRSPLPDGRLVRFDWDLDDDGAFEVVDQAHVAWNWRVDPAAGAPDRHVRLRVTDADGRVSTLRQRLDIRLGAVPPSADADPEGAPEAGYDAVLGGGLRLDGSQSVDPQGSRRIVAWRWDLDHDPEVGFEADIDADEPVVHVPADQLAELGVFETGRTLVALQVEDADGLVGQDVAPVEVHAEDPVAVFAPLPARVAPGAPVVLDGRGAHHPHPDVRITEWAWAYTGDGAFDDARGAQLTVRFDRFTFGVPIEIALRVTDSAGNQAVHRQQIHVDAGNRAPVAEAGGWRNGDAVAGPYVVAPGDALRLSAAGSVDPDAAFGDRLERFDWDLDGDGDADRAGPEPAPIPWADLVALGLGARGDHPITLRVTDRHGAVSQAAATLRVVDGPTARIRAPGRAACDTAVALDATASSADGPAAQGFELVGYHWDLDGDGDYDDATGPRATVRPVARPDDPAGLARAVALRVTDAGGRTHTATHAITVDVDNVPPLADAGGPYRTGPLGDGFAPVTLDGRGSFDANAPCDDVHTYKWDLDGDGVFGAADGEPEGATAQVPGQPTWRVGTTSTVALVACDRFGACSAPADAVIEILGESPPSGTILSPTAGDCVGVAAAEARVAVADPLGDRVRVRLEAAGVVLASLDGVATPEDGSPTTVALPFDPSRVPAGAHRLTLRITDESGAEAVTRSAEPVPFDRAAPTVEFGALPGEGVCYRPDAQPEADVRADDPDAVIRTEIVQDGCLRTVRATATDACGNVGQAERQYLVAEPVALTIDGPDEGARAAEARYTWAVDGPEACAANIDASYRVDGAEPVPYAEGEPILDGGRVVVTWRVANCLGIARDQVRTVEIGRGALAVAVPPERRPVDGPYDYVADEGQPLELDGRASTTRGRAGEIVAWAWDFDGDGQTDAEGPNPVFPTAADGDFTGRLRVTDDLGAQGEAPLRVRVRDHHPTADAGGPYAGDQGQPIRLDASGSRGHAADPLTRFEWRFANGVVVESDGPVIEHVFEADGLQTFTVVAHDEDDTAQAEGQVQVADVDPVAVGIRLPEDPRELWTLDFTALAESGGAGDPITRYEWDFDDDGEFEVAGPDFAVGGWPFRRPGEYPVRLRVWDGDSFSEASTRVTIRECTFDEVLEWVGSEIAALRANPQLPPLHGFALANFDQLVHRARWGERHGHRGVTLLATERMNTQLRQAQGFGLDVGLELFGLARQLVREAPRHQAAFLADRGAGQAGHPSVNRARDLNQTTADLGAGDTFEADLADPRRSAVASEVQWSSMEAYAHFEDAVHACAQDYAGFPMPEVADVLARAQAANDTNDDVHAALGGLLASLDSYLALGNPADLPPGRAQVAAARARVVELRALVAQRVGILCEDDEGCITDRDALELLLGAADVLDDLNVARTQGAYVRQWRTCLALSLRFRTELSVLRAEYACGQNVPLVRRARANHHAGVSLFEEGSLVEALDFYADTESRCLMIETYNRCLVPHWPENRAVAYPQACLNNN